MFALSKIFGAWLKSKRKRLRATGNIEIGTICSVSVSVVLVKGAEILQFVCGLKCTFGSDFLFGRSAL